jgi:hypothetical protein
MRVNLPSWEKFINVLENGYLFTDYSKRTWSRSYKKIIEWIIDNYLTDEQKKKCIQT